MLDYCEYLALKHANPEEKLYAETIVYEIPECGSVVCQWDGYLLDRIFGIDIPNVRELFDEATWGNIVQEVRASRFWDRNWNWPVYIAEAFRKNGLELKNLRGDFEKPPLAKSREEKVTLRRRLIDTAPGQFAKRNYRKLRAAKYIGACEDKKTLFYTGKEDCLTGHRLSLIHYGNDIERIEGEIRRAFVFPEITDEKNLRMQDLIRKTNSVGIHARRGDSLGYNSVYYRYGYFRRAVNYIKSQVKDPVFIFFSEPGSIEWCRENQRCFGLDFSKDRVVFAEQNTGADSFRDMQLMAQCKHQIFTTSSFGWWAAFFNTYPNKITCSPDITVRATHHF